VVILQTEGSGLTWPTTRNAAAFDVRNSDFVSDQRLGLVGAAGLEPATRWL